MHLVPRRGWVPMVPPGAPGWRSTPIARRWVPFQFLRCEMSVKLHLSCGDFKNVPEYQIIGYLKLNGCSWIQRHDIAKRPWDCWCFLEVKNDEQAAAVRKVCETALFAKTDGAPGMTVSFRYARPIPVTRHERHARPRRGSTSPDTGESNGRIRCSRWEQQSSNQD